MRGERIDRSLTRWINRYRGQNLECGFNLAKRGEDLRPLNVRPHLFDNLQRDGEAFCARMLRAGGLRFAHALDDRFRNKNAGNFIGKKFGASQGR